MNSKVRAKKNIIRLGALLLAALMIIGLLATVMGPGDITGTGFDYSAPFTAEGHFKGVKASDCVTLPDYASYTIPQSLTVADQEMVDQQIQTVIDNFTTEEKDADTERAIVDGDTVNIDYVGTIDGVEFEGGSTQGAGTDVTIGVTQYIDGFLEQLIGHKPGENFDINVTFPEDYGKEELNGKAAVFNITINHFYKEIVPELTDEFVAENMSNYYSTVDEMKAYFEKTLVDDAIKNYVWEKLDADCTVSEYPQAMKDYEISYLKFYMESYASQMGMTAEDLLTMSGVESMDEYIESNKESIEETVKMYVIVQALAETEGVEVTDEDITEYFKTYYGTDDYTAFATNYGKPYIKFCVMREAVLEHLISGMEIVEG